MIALHHDFKLNGVSFSSEKELLTYAQKEQPAIHTFLSDWFDAFDVINVQTSGSTGKPKIISIKKTFMVNSAKATQAFFNLPSKTTALLCLSPNFIAGKMMLVRAMTLGWHIDVISAAGNPLQNTKKAYDFSAMVPLQVQQSLQDLKRVKLLIVGGAAISSKLFMQLQKMTTKVYATYGMTETVTHIAVKKINVKVTSSDNSIDSPCFQTLPNVSISTDRRGCLVIDAPMVSSKKIITNDLVTIISKTHFKWLGRFDNIINSGGIKVIPEEIEAKLAALIPQRFFISALKDVLLGEKIILIIESNSENTTLLDRIKNTKGISKYQLPKAIYNIPQFVETASGKIQRAKTRTLLKT